MLKSREIVIKLHLKYKISFSILPSFKYIRYIDELNIYNFFILAVQADYTLKLKLCSDTQTKFGTMKDAVGKAGGLYMINDAVVNQKGECQKWNL